jgi:hypothetical protein
MTAGVPHSTDVCRRIAAARSASGLTPAGLAQSLTACTGLDVSARDVRRFERSRVPWRFLEEIARLTETSTDWLLYGEGPPPGAHVSPERGGAEAAGASGDGDGVWRPSAGRVTLGLLLGFLAGVAILAMTGSVPVAVAGTITITLIAYVRSSPGER